MWGFAKLIFYVPKNLHLTLKKHLIALNMKFNIAKVWKENIYAKKRTQVQAYSWTDLKVPILKSQYK